MTPCSSRIVAVALAALVSQTSLWAAPAEDRAARTWSSSSGQFVIEATLLQSNDTHVQLGTADGRKIAVRIDQRPDTTFFTRLTIPPRIPKLEIADGLGLSSLNGAEWRDISAEDLARAKARRGR